ncbi:Protein of unknown function [Pyronema omphalodes CBS 100304]|uniref:Uncharacterized protein n=1 Tax=Pyronema omphalodes (strain CBS 100304) TaxID=1076935 RepID=U4LJQ7_PYROM|nr:Protein of unknown function [Pyronema omphalodes CBS 100304]
MRVLGSLAGV